MSKSDMSSVYNSITTRSAETVMIWIVFSGTEGYKAENPGKSLTALYENVFWYVAEGVNWIF